MSLRSRFLDTVLLLGSIVFITVFHYTTPLNREPIHELLRRLYYLPVVYTALRLGWRGGLLAAGVTTLVYFPHLLHYIKAHTCQSVNNYADMVILFCLGGGLGFLRDKQQHADRLALLGATTARIVHDMKNPIASVEAAAQLLKEDLPKEQRDEFSGIISESVQRFLDMTAELLEFSRSGVERLNRSLASLDSFLADTAACLRPQFEKDGVRLIVESKGAGEAEWDWERMRRVVNNIAQNALEVLRQGGSLKIESCAKDNDILLRFTDDGPGMPPHIRRRIFNAFFSRGKAGGTGLGLAISRDVVVKHGGSIKVESSAGKGTTFTITLPRTPPLPGGHPQGEKQKADD